MANYYTDPMLVDTTQRSGSFIVPTNVTFHFCSVPNSALQVFSYGALLAATCFGALACTQYFGSELSIALQRPTGFLGGLARGQVMRMQAAATEAPALAPLSLDTLSSRADRPIIVPNGVKLSRKDGVLTVQGPKGKLERAIPDEVKLREENSILLITYDSPERRAKAMFGLYRALINNMVRGVNEEFVKKMEMVGVGYRARVEGKNLILAVGKSHDVILPIPEGLKVVVEENTRLIISGVSNEAVGQFCAVIRRERPPEPYKGKGIRYLGEKITLKEGKGAKGKK